MPFDFVTPGALSAATACWLISARKGGPLTAVLDGGRALMAWGDRAGAEKYLRTDREARQASTRIQPWTLGEVIAFCRKKGICQVMPDQAAKEGGLTVTVGVESMAGVLEGRPTHPEAEGAGGAVPSPLAQFLAVLEVILESGRGPGPDVRKLLNLGERLHGLAPLAGAEAEFLSRSRPLLFHAFRAAGSAGLTLSNVIGVLVAVDRDDPGEARVDQLLAQFGVLAGLFSCLRSAVEVLRATLGGE